MSRRNRNKQKRYNKVSLEGLNNAVQNKEDIDISNQDAMKANKIIIIKRVDTKNRLNLRNLIRFWIGRQKIQNL